MNILRPLVYFIMICWAYLMINIPSLLIYTLKYTYEDLVYIIIYRGIYD